MHQTIFVRKIVCACYVQTKMHFVTLKGNGKAALPSVFFVFFLSMMIVATPLFRPAWSDALALSLLLARSLWLAYTQNAFRLCLHIVR